MRLEELAGAFRRIKTCSRVCLANEPLLCIITGHCDACCFSILVDTSLANDTLNGVSVSQCLAQGLENDGCHTFLCDETVSISRPCLVGHCSLVVQTYSTRVAVSFLVPHATPTSRGKHLDFALEDIRDYTGG